MECEASLLGDYSGTSANTSTDILSVSCNHAHFSYIYVNKFVSPFDTTSQNCLLISFTSSSLFIPVLLQSASQSIRIFKNVE